MAALEGSLGLLLESWWAPGALLEASWSLLEPSWSRLGVVLEDFGELSRPSWERIGSQKGTKWVPNQAPDATQVQVGKTSKIGGRLMRNPYF